ncbi:hypothetical protein PG996_004945 [Apiospora saccharicola]|uniref:Uncharacterized protein n=1 Tax=Apiospora saccharicola TaxID=335842 RepID=A0ABR1VK44_9PEZI
MGTGSDTSGQESLGATEIDLDLAAESVSGTLLLSDASRSASPPNPSPDETGVLTEAILKGVGKLMSESAKVFLLTVQSFVEPHGQRLRARLESGDPVVYYAMTACMAGVLVLVILLVVLAVRVPMVSTGKTIANTDAGAEVLLLDWLRTRAVSPYSTLSECLRGGPSCPAGTMHSGSSMYGTRSSTAERDGGIPLMGYLVTNFSKMA